MFTGIIETLKQKSMVGVAARGRDDTNFPSKNAKCPNWRCSATRSRVFSTAIHNLLTRLTVPS